MCWHNKTVSIREKKGLVREGVNCMVGGGGVKGVNCMVGGGGGKGS